MAENVPVCRAGTPGPRWLAVFAGVAVLADFAEVLVFSTVVANFGAFAPPRAAGFGVAAVAAAGPGVANFGAFARAAGFGVTAVAAAGPGWAAAVSAAFVEEREDRGAVAGWDSATNAVAKFFFEDAAAPMRDLPLISLDKSK